MRIFNKMSVIFLTLLCLSCAKRIEENHINYEELAYDLFNHYGYEFNSIMPKEESDFGEIYIDKKSMSINEYNSYVRKEIKVKGWVEVKPEFEDQDIYCLGRTNMITVLYPRKKTYTDKYGSNIYIEDSKMGKWIIYYYNNNYGVDGCK